MICEKCGKHPATTHIRTVLNGKVHEQNLCDECAKAYGYGGINGNPLDNLFASLFGEVLPHSGETVCPDCGCTLSQISATGKVGCSTCYTAFYDQLLPYIQRIHGSHQHIGSLPQKAAPQRNKKPSVEELRRQLKELVAAEKYEQAAQVRDEIKRLEGGADK